MLRAILCLQKTLYCYSLYFYHKLFYDGLYDGVTSVCQHNILIFIKNTNPPLATLVLPIQAKRTAKYKLYGGFFVLENSPKTVSGIGYYPFHWPRDGLVSEWSFQDRYKISAQIIIIFLCQWSFRFPLSSGDFSEASGGRCGDLLDDQAVYFAVIAVRRNALDAENDVANEPCRHFVAVDEWWGQDIFQYRGGLFDMVGIKAALRLVNRRFEAVGMQLIPSRSKPVWHGCRQCCRLSDNRPFCLFTV